ncbi:hypothetical protein IVA79_15155 [Bradyrhizobium sp. 138]|uniref:lipopolysaccharide biosynthesis protein n=1 Tax=Bradyrhizobium sp. 138 TaxID=2782615 RepID=UPI001FFAEED4|nr:hypothetical protein [Bradyrhizobium sp. 138]MCK1735275.1 hypothetical protein [Bradyrhizobium sp. 138]
MSFDDLIKSLPSRVSSIADRLGATMLANLANQAVVVFSQIAVVPILIASWGLAGFGTWIVLTAVPTYAGLSDFGLSISAKSDMAMRVSRGDLSGARQTLSSVLAIAIVMIVLFGLAYIAAIFALDWTRILSLGSSITEHSAKVVLCLGLVQIVFYQAFLFSATIIRAMGRPALESSLSAIGRGSEILAVVIVARLGGSLAAAAAAWACSRVLLSVGIWIAVLYRYPMMRPGALLVSRTRIKSLLGPSIGYAMMPVAQSIAIQGTTLAVSSFSGPSGAAAFNTIRVITRLGTQLANTVNNSFVPYYSYAIGRNSGVLRLFKEHMGLILFSLVVYLALVMMLGEMFLRIISKGKIPFEPGLFSILVAAGCAEMLFSSIISMQSAANKVGPIAGSYALFAIATVSLSYVFGATLGVTGVASLVLAASLATLGASVFVLFDKSRSVLRGG